MNIEEIKRVLSAKPNQVVGINFEPSIKPLVEYSDTYARQMGDVLRKGMWLNLDVTSSSNQYPDIHFSMIDVGDHYSLIQHLYKRSSMDRVRYYEFDSVESACEHIIDELREHANPKDLDKFLDYENIKDHSETLSQDDFAGLDDYEISR